MWKEIVSPESLDTPPCIGPAIFLALARYGFGLRASMEAAAVPGSPPLDRVVFVFDLGGGTFDVTLFLLGPYKIDVMGTSGKRRLGGQDFTVALVDMVMEKIFAANPAVDLRRDPRARCDLAAAFSPQLRPRLPECAGRER